MNRERPACPSQAPADPRELAQEIAEEARSRGGLLIFTDFERMLRLGAANGRGAGLPLLVRGALVALASTPTTGVVINSGHDVCDLETHVNVPGLIYAGCRGLQVRGAGMTFCHPVAARLRPALPVLAQELSQCLGSLPGVEVEIKELGVTVHARRADPSAVSVIVALRRDEPGLKGGMRTAGVERVIAHVLLWGGLLGGLLVVLGLILFIGRGGFERPVLEVQRLIRPGRGGHPPEVFVSVPEVLRGLRARPVDPLAVIALGLVLLLIMPVVSVAAAIPAFLAGGDRQYAAIAGVVLSMLLFSLLLAGGAG